MQTQFDPIRIKKIPCNGCREKKRKCSYGQPCARCAKSGAECTYTIMPSPKDLEYMQELEFMNQIDQLQQQLNSMEAEISILKLEKDTKDIIQGYPSPESIGPDFVSHTKDNSKNMQLIYNASPPTSPTTTHDLFENKYIFHTNNNLQIELAKPVDQKTQPWRLTIHNGTMTIETDITTHSDLITSMNSMLPSAIYQQQTDKLPFPFNIIPTERRDATNRVIRILIWQKYGKSRFKSLTKYTPALMHYEPPRQVTTQVMPAEQLAPLMMRMLYIYFGCLHINHFCVYVSGFIRLFMKSKDQVLQSPAVLSMCSVICHQHCKHIMKIMPVEVSSEYGLFFFEQARDLVADRFDEVSLETLITYTFMALYKTKTKADQEAQDYLCIAERIRTLLLPQYGWKPEYNSTNVSDEVMTFDRISDCIQHIRTVLELHYVMQKVTKFKKAKAHGVLELIDNHDIRPKHIGPDDTEQEKKAIRLGTYTTQLREAIKQTADCAAAQDLPTYISVFGHQIEMAMRHWYRSVLPQEFRLSLPLFDDMIPDFEFFTVLEIECGSDPYPLIAAIALYNEYLIMAKSCVPKTPLDPKLNPEEIVCRLKEVINKPNQIDTSLPPRERRWLIHFMQKLRHLRQHRQDFFTEDELEESEEEFMTRFIRALDLSKVNFDMPLIHTSVRVALNMVRLIQFLLTREYSCRLDLRWVMNAWDILLRAAAFRYQQPDDPSVTLDRIRANLILCLEFIRDNVDLARKDPSGEFMAQIQQQFDKSFM